MPGEPDFGSRRAAAPDASLLRRMQFLADLFIDDGQSAVAESDLADCLSMLERVWPGSSLGASPTPASSSATRDTWIEDAKPVVGRFLVRRLLGQGGFGAVFLVFDATMGRDVALKIPQPSLLGSSEVRRRFVREAQAAALLDHPHIVPVYESGEVGAMWYIAIAAARRWPNGSPSSPSRLTRNSRRRSSPIWRTPCITRIAGACCTVI
jgi:hypothetical protein